jgi:hypothetical protein
MRVLIPSALAILLVPAAWSATATTLEGGAATGPLTWGPATAAVGGMALEDLDTVVIASGDAVRPGPRGVFLVDGSWLPADRITDAGGDRVAATGPWGEIVLPLLAVRGWSDGELPPAPDQGDLVVGPAGPVAGQITGLAQGALLLTTSLAPEPVPVPLDGLSAVRLAGPGKPASGLTLAVRLRPDRPPLRLRPGPVPTLAVAPGATVPGWDAPIWAGQRAVVEGGRRVWLSDRTPTSVREQGLFGVTWPWRADADLDGLPLALGGTIHGKGLTVHSEAELSWDLAGTYVRFAAVMGIVDAMGPEGDCEVAWLVDGAVRWSRRLRGGEPPVEVACDLAGARTLALRIVAGARHDIGDHVGIGSAWLARRP